MTDFNVGIAIREIRLRYGLTQGELANGICDQTLISRIEKGAVIPSSFLLMKLAKRIGVDVNYLLNLAHYSNADYVREVTEQVDRMLKEKSFEELKEFVKCERENPLFKSTEGEQYFLWLEGVCAYYVDKTPNIAIQSLEQALSKRETTSKSKSDIDITILNSLCVILSEEQKYEQAATLYEVLIEEVDIHPSLPFKLKAKILYNYSKVLINLYIYDLAIAICQKGIKCCQQHDSLFLLGNFHYQLGFLLSLDERYQEAMVEVARASMIFSIENREDLVAIAEQRKTEYTQKLISIQ
ncbi:helix-turn-helix domain-containing protein [Alkalihalophilus lindianensis]|uniref:Helix-turn-helix domain-containing protein n=1 Tax=Alkalihalophilus lindianensis TaxID=1630542 RepID=A0ABU3X934_9BACI|nr:helix-turn-helix domain-containing protein [Alkalihalophilus lindianensis]MDV2684383.1 helix-turn-helix domain-containing protein [Alkalihalophilus lindianensis]